MHQLPRPGPSARHRHGRRIAAVAAFLVGLAAASNGCAATQSTARTEAPNIVIILADDLGWADVGYHTDSISTPNIDRMAGEGVRMNRFYAAPVCSATRAGLMTGRYPDRMGLRDGVINTNDRHGLPPAAVTIPEALDSAGYTRRAALGKWHLGHSNVRYHPLNHGFTEFYGAYTGATDYFSHRREGELDWHRNFETSHDEGYSTDLLAAEAERFIKASAGDEPFFLYLSFNAVHGPLQAKSDHLDRFGYDPSLPVYGGASWARFRAAEGGLVGNGNTLRQTYLAALASMDEAIGRVLAALDAEGIAENTLVLFLSDNGGPTHEGADNSPLRGSKSTVWEGGVRVPAVARWPGRLRSGEKVDELVAYVDLLPTLRRVAGRPPAQAGALDGIDVLDVLESSAAGPDRLVYLGDGGIVSRQWKYVQGQLFDLLRDPYETTDVAAANPAVMRRMERALKAFEKIEAPPTEVGRYRRQPEWRMPT